MKLADVEWAAAARPAAPGEELGDGYLVKPNGNGILFAVADGLGHGRAAAAAARLALAAIERSPHSALERICSDCHHELHPSRGAVLGLAHLNSGSGELQWIGVGGVNAAVWRARPAPAAPFEHLVTYHGVLGRHLPVLRAVRRSLARGDLLVLTTDGIRPGFDLGARENEPAERIAARVLERAAVGGDDALVLVARYRGESP